MAFRRIQLLALLFLLIASPARAEAPPNIVLVLIDDLGWMDLHCQGNEKLDTPFVDRLASEGMRFTSAYAASPVCSPTRASIMTGRAPARLRITNHISNRDFTPKNAKVTPPKDTRRRLALEEVTIAERLREAGYATGFFGKWHLAGVPRRHGLGLPAFYPEHQGFDLNLGGCAHGGPPSFFDPYKIHNLPDRKEGEYLPDRLADETIRFMREQNKRKKPFFVALWNYTVHWPMQAPEPLIKKYQSRLGPGLKNATYGAMIEAMDAAIRRVVDAVDEMGQRERTLVIFMSDNGGFLGVADNRPLRSGKGFLYEGGIRVPLIVRWPGKIRPNAISDTPVISTDLFPTILAAAGLRPDPQRQLDGVDLNPLLQGKGQPRREALYFHYPNYAWHSSNRLGGAVRAGRYKLIERFDDGSLELFDLKKDLSERSNLASAMPELAQRLAADLRGWRASVKAAMPAPVE